MDKDYFIQLEVLPAFTFKIWKKNISANKWQNFYFSSLYSLTAEDKDSKTKRYENFFTLDDDLIVCISFILIYTRQNCYILQDRLTKKTRNIKVINQYGTFFILPSNKNKYSYDSLFQITRKEEEEANESYFRKIYMGEVLSNMKECLNNYTAELKSELKLPEFQSHSKKEDNIALVGLVSRNNKVMLAVASQDSNENNISVLLKPKQFVSLFNAIDKPVIIQQHKEAEKTKYQQAKPQIIAYFLPDEGTLKVIQGISGDIITHKDDIVKQDSFKIDIDLLLTYYKVLEVELKNKERFEELLYGAETYSNSFKII